MKYEEIKIGATEKLVHVITQQDLDKFVELTGDDNKLHVDKEYASQTSFKKPVVHGMLGASFISTLIGTRLPGDGALWYSQTLEFLAPVRIDDKITITANVTKKHDRDRIVELQVEILNQNKQVVTRGLSKVKIVPTIESSDSEEKPPHGPRTALVLGATGGIGEATCLQLGQAGFNVIIHYYNNKSKANFIKNKVLELGRKAKIIRADLFDQTQIEELSSSSLRTFGKIDVFVNCAAAVIPPISVTDLAWQDLTRQLEVNIRVNLTIIQNILPHMKKNNYGKIVTVGTFYADKPVPNMIHYITAKSALEGFTKSLAFEVGNQGINVNMVSPSVLDTDLTADIPEKAKLLTAAQTPLRRLATPEDVAKAIVFLAGDDSSFLSGENIRLNGGQVMV
jgi:3-oxoacyl-[acyl-carrier protein] reductase